MTERLVETGRLASRLRQFAADRDWNQFHSPKNLVMALGAEAGELTEIFQWLTEENSHRVTEDARSGSRVREELADVLIYLVRLADVLGVDLDEAAREKISDNERKYPADRFRGSARKYTESPE